MTVVVLSPDSVILCLTTCLPSDVCVTESSVSKLLHNQRLSYLCIYLMSEILLFVISLNKVYSHSCKYIKKRNQCMSIKQVKLIANARETILASFIMQQQAFLY